MKAQTEGSLRAVLDVLIVGSSDSSGGVVMQQSQASFGSPGVPGQYQGSIVGLDGSRMLLALHDQAGGSLALRVDVSIAGSQFTGQFMSVTSGSGSFGDDN